MTRKSESSSDQFLECPSLQPESEPGSESRAGRKLLDATVNVKALENLTSRKIRVTPETRVELQLDGDPIGLIAEVEFEAISRAVSVRS